MKFDNQTIPTDDGLTLAQYSTIIKEIQEQPLWRADASMCGAFFDGKPFTQEMLYEIEKRGMAPIFDNKIKPLVNAVLGIEVRSRANWRVAVDGDEMQDMAEALSYKLSEAKRETYADIACSEAFADQIKCALGWVFISKNADPFGYDYRVENIPWSEIWWDWRARRKDLSDARYLLRQRWYPTSAVCAAFPKHSQVIQDSAGGWLDETMAIIHDGNDASLYHGAYLADKTYGDWDTWRNDEGRSVLVRELWYRVWQRGDVIRFRDGRTTVFNKKNPVHLAAIQFGMGEVFQTAYQKLRASLWVGPHKIEDVDCGQTPIPYIPFWCYREVSTNIPYGIVRDMIPLQMEINSRRQKLAWLLASKRVTVEEGALAQNWNDFDSLMENVAQPDSLVVVRNGQLNGIRVETDLALSTAQLSVMAEAADSIQKSAGIYSSMLGKVDSGASSGRAIASLVEQGNTMQASINDNYRYARSLVGDRLIRLIVQDMEGVPTTVNIRRIDNSTKEVKLNWEAFDNVTGMTYAENDTSRAMFKVGLEDVPSTPAYRAQTMAMISDVLKGMPPNIQGMMVPFWLRATELPQRDEMAKLVERIMGVSNNEEQDPEKEKLKQAVQQGAQLIQALQEQLKTKQQDEAVKTKEVEARTIEAQARAGEAQARAQQADARMLEAEARAHKANAETQKIQTETQIMQSAMT